MLQKINREIHILGIYSTPRLRQKLESLNSGEWKRFHEWKVTDHNHVAYYKEPQIKELENHMKQFEKDHPDSQVGLQCIYKKRCE